MQASASAISEYVREHVRPGKNLNKAEVRTETGQRIEKTLSLLPDDILELFLTGRRTLLIIVEPTLKIPFGMSTRTRRSESGFRYTITIREEHEEWPEDLFLGALLRELGHVVRERPPEEEWPVSRGDRARYREKLEYQADAMVWRWGLRHYSMRHLYATYPEHWAEKIAEEVEKTLSEEEKLQ